MIGFHSKKENNLQYFKLQLFIHSFKLYINSGTNLSFILHRILKDRNEWKKKKKIYKRRGIFFFLCRVLKWWRRSLFIKNNFQNRINISTTFSSFIDIYLFTQQKNVIIVSGFLSLSTLFMYLWTYWANSYYIYIYISKLTYSTEKKL